MTKSLRYLVVIERAESGYSSWAPDFPGCVAAGETAQECEENMCDAIALHLAGIAEAGEEPPESTTVATALVEVDVG
ncbi:MAG TPA: type II toxin-antitoxin system HicB family antitoxin [Mycobacteriales bacterium]|nr:type II toxin-antitoxin system HicB family antitoxin [Mycobacteriales bacterium]